MYGFMGYATVLKIRRASCLACLALTAFLGIGQAQATVQYRFVPTSIAMNGVPLGPLQLENVGFSVSDAAVQAGNVAANVTCLRNGSCAGPNSGLTSVMFFEQELDATLRPDGLVDGFYRATRDASFFDLSGAGLLWSGRYGSEFPYSTAAASNQRVQCAGSLASGGCVITGYFLAEPVTTPGQGVPVPEPASAALLAVGLLTLARRRR